ncbi:hypothetical protein BDV27DRAFT_125793 [Aspergillus caelatus]|uniref:Uncharacterized protein n=1 Tax=Aspergillus caelatus TaxID=61420 RepID=A0A5N7AAH3_9EURO|nr:uncharacterized protein BDV27DRAFT_125793 [Aspergillus caelatus]KAE8366166.1 hypothetical protein BDV27DRAFT_125793 [Aspergillus caelatus]
MMIYSCSIFHVLHGRSGPHIVKHAINQVSYLAESKRKTDNQLHSPSSHIQQEETSGITGKSSGHSSIKVQPRPLSTISNPTPGSPTNRPSTTSSVADNLPSKGKFSLTG